MDYLLRDSHHSGVGYGRYDWPRLVHSAVAVPMREAGGPGLRIGVSEGGWHAAEALIIARYLMFTQVYFHKTRVLLDRHLQHALAALLPGARFPAPIGDALDEYLGWDDWRVLGMLAEGRGGEHGARLFRRDHYREIRHTTETPSAQDLELLGSWRAALGELIAEQISSEASWYKTGPTDVLILAQGGKADARPLSHHSPVVRRMEAVKQVRLYVDANDRAEAERRLRDL